MNGNFGINSTWGLSNSQYNPIYIEDYWDFLEFLKPRTEEYFQLQNDIDLSMLQTHKYGLFPGQRTLNGNGRRLINLKISSPLFAFRVSTITLYNIIFDNLKCDNPSIKHPLADFNYETELTGIKSFKKYGNANACVFILNDEWASSEINFFAPCYCNNCLFVAPNKTAVLPKYNILPNEQSRANDLSEYCGNNFFRIQNFKIDESVKNFYYRMSSPVYVYEDSPRVGSVQHERIPTIIPRDKKTNLEVFNSSFTDFLKKQQLFYLDEQKGYNYKTVFKGKFLFKVGVEYYSIDSNSKLKKIEQQNYTESQLVSIYGTTNLNLLPQKIYKELQSLGEVELKTLGNFANLYAPTTNSLNFQGGTNKQICNITNTELNRMEV